MIIYLMVFRLLDPLDARKVARIWRTVWADGLWGQEVPVFPLEASRTTSPCGQETLPRTLVSFSLSPLTNVLWLGGGGRHSHSAVKNHHLKKDNLDVQVNLSRGNGIMWIPPTITLDAPIVGKAFPRGFLCYPFPGVSLQTSLCHTFSPQKAAIFSSWTI